MSLDTCPMCDSGRRVTKKLRSKTKFNRMCSPCYKKEQKLAKEVIEDDTEFVAKPEFYHSDRKCRSCKGKLTKNRWWDCINCKPVIDDDSYETAYGTLAEGWEMNKRSEQIPRTRW